MVEETVPFAGGALNRSAHLRGQAQDLLAASNAKILPFADLRPCFTPEGALAVSKISVLEGLFDKEKVIFLGLSPESEPLFAAPLNPKHFVVEEGSTFLANTVVSEALPEYEFRDLRASFAHLDPLDAEVAATGRGLLSWHARHGYCSNCGVKTHPEMGGWQTSCPECETKHFPRTDPVVIMHVTFGNKCLLGRSPGWPDGMYSTLAGFVEPGETPEAAVAREVMEEAGVVVKNPRYVASQPWPFPASLMLGYTAEAEGLDLKIDENELEDALWVTREEMVEIAAGAHPVIKAPRKGAIAQRLLSKWLEDSFE